MRKSAYPLEKTSERGIYRRGGRYVVVFRDPAGRQRKRFARTFDEARTIKSTIRADLKRGEWNEEQPVAELTFEDYAREWLDTYKGRTRSGVRPATVADYRRNLEADAIPFLGKRRLASIGPRDIKKLIAEIEKRDVSYDTVRISLAPVRALFATAVEEELVKTNPTTAVRITRSVEFEETDSGEDDVKALSEEQIHRLLTRMPQDYRLLVEFLIHSGLRIGEAIALQWQHIDIASRRVRVRRRFYRGTFAPPKSKYGRREVKLTPGMAEKLARRRADAERSGDSDLVFPAARGGPVSYAYLFSVFKPAAKAAGVSWAGFHTLRHTCATRLFLAGLNAKQVQLWLGHHSPAFTLATYVHLLPDDLPDAPFFDDLTGGQHGQHDPQRTDEIDASTPAGDSGQVQVIPLVGASPV